MAAVSSVIVTNRMCLALAQGDVDFTTGTYQAALFLKDAWTPNKDDDFIQSITTAGADELSGGTYARVTLGSKSVAQDNTNDDAQTTCATVNFGAIAAGITQDDYDTMVIFRFVTGDSDSWPALIYLLDAVYSTDGVAIQFTINADGLYEVQQA